MREAKRSLWTVPGNFYPKVEVTGPEVGHMEPYTEALFNRLDISYGIPRDQEVVDVNSDDSALTTKDGGVGIEWIETLLCEERSEGVILDTG